MNDPSRSLATALALDLRTPLSRVALATDQLARDASTPAQIALARTVVEAVGELDARITRLTAVLCEPSLGGAADARREDIGGVLQRLHGRLAPGIAAHGVDWQPPRSDAPVACGESHLVRRSAVALLRAGICWAGIGGALALSPAARTEGGGIQLECRPAGRHRPDQDPIAELGSFASANHLLLEASQRGDGRDASLWLPS